MRATSAMLCSDLTLLPADVLLMLWALLSERLLLKLTLSRPLNTRCGRIGNDLRMKRWSPDHPTRQEQHFHTRCRPHRPTLP
ncbi:hypothetical protein GCM10007933_17200 [Zoogloea oryzae]|uniref:Secreted protein n=1 Tax=Zoogloea oryzae TaxID=310767 RepID=A0ABQ6FBV4_9RHOO|nr:hypothetical protein GCM10007933_17200 [Zoogloea oryzae]